MKVTEETIRFQTNLNKESLIKIKIIAVNNNCNVNDLLNEAMIYIINKYENN